MSELTTIERHSTELDLSTTRNQHHSSILKVQVLKLKLREERQQDKLVYQSIKQKIANL